MGVEVDRIQAGLAQFEGVGRRFQSHGMLDLPAGGQALLVDDYGHHLTEIEATLKAARAAFPEQKINLVFPATPV